MPTHDEAIEIGVDGQRLAGTLVAPATTIPGILFVHGWGGSQEQYLARAREVAALGCVSLTFDLRGHARSDGRNEAVSREDNLRDVLAAYDTLTRHPAVDDVARQPERTTSFDCAHGRVDVLELRHGRPAGVLAAPACARWQPDRKRLGKVFGRVALRVPVTEMQHVTSARGTRRVARRIAAKL